MPREHGLRSRCEIGILALEEGGGADEDTDNGEEGDQT